MSITLSMSKDEALILSDMLDRISENRDIFPDVAERQVLWAIEGQLEVILDELFMPNYTDLVSEAKDRVRSEDK